MILLHYSYPSIMPFMVFLFTYSQRNWFSSLFLSYLYLGNQFYFLATNLFVLIAVLFYVDYSVYFWCDKPTYLLIFDLVSSWIFLLLLRNPLFTCKMSEMLIVQETRCHSNPKSGTLSWELWISKSRAFSWLFSSQWMLSIPLSLLNYLFCPAHPASHCPVT